MRSLILVGFAGVMLAAATLAFAQGAPGGAAAPMAELKVGDKAPNFKLQGTDGKTHQLADYAGKKAVVIAWFPAAFTQGCTIECKSLAEHGDMIKKYQVQYFMASVDPIEKNIEFANAKSVMLNGQEVTTEELLRQPDGKQRWESIHYAPNRDSEGNVIGIYAVHTDIHEEKHNAEALRRAN